MIGFEGREHLFQLLRSQSKSLPAAQSIVGATWAVEYESAIGSGSSIPAYSITGGVFATYRHGERWKFGSKSLNFAETQIIGYQDINPIKYIESLHKIVTTDMVCIVDEVYSTYRLKFEIIVNTICYFRSIINVESKELYENKGYLRLRCKLRCPRSGKVVGRKQWVLPIGSCNLTLKSSILQWVLDNYNQENDSRAERFHLFEDVTGIELLPEAASALFHELIGHPAEKDCNATLSRSTRDSLTENEFLSSITLYDDPLDETLVGYQTFDDDGEFSSRTILAKDGCIANKLASLSAGFHPLSGEGRNSRKMYHSSPALPRGTNLILEPGRNCVSKPDMKYILRVPSFSSAHVVPGARTFRLIGSSCSFIVDGVQYAVGDVLLRGSIDRALRSICWIGNDVESSILSCGKLGQWVHIGTRSPTIILDVSSIRQSR